VIDGPNAVLNSFPYPHQAFDLLNSDRLSC